MVVRFLGIGDNTVDDYTHLRTLFPGGNALNVAVYASMLGCDAAYVGVFGSDAAANHMQQTLAELGLDTSRSTRAEGPSGKAMLAIEDGERIFTGSNGGGVRKSVSMEFAFDDVDYLKSFPLAHTSTYSFIDEHLPRLASLVPIVSYDFSDDFETAKALSLCTYIDVPFFSCPDSTDEETQNLLQSAVDQGCMLAAATRGMREAILFDGHSWYRQAPHPVTPIDTLGAGDGFISAFLVSCFEGHSGKETPAPESIERALDKAASFAAKTCLVQGAFGRGLGY